MVDRLARVGVNVITDLESFSTGGLCLSFGIGFKVLYKVFFQSICIDLLEFDRRYSPEMKSFLIMELPINHVL